MQASRSTYGRGRVTQRRSRMPEWRPGATTVDDASPAASAWAMRARCAATRLPLERRRSRYGDLSVLSSQPLKPLSQPRPLLWFEPRAQALLQDGRLRLYRRIVLGPARRKRSMRSASVNPSNAPHASLQPPPWPAAPPRLATGTLPRLPRRAGKTWMPPVSVIAPRRRNRRHSATRGLDCAFDGSERKTPTRA